MTTTGRVVENREVQRPHETSIRYSISGPPEGPAVVLIHGWACHRGDFDALTGFLPGGYRVIAVDLAEHGESRSSRENWTIEEFARDVVSVLDAESVTDCVVAGHSLGGAVAVETARLRPGAVRHVIALDALHYLFLFGALDEEQAEGLLQPLRTDFAGLVRSMVEAGSPPDTDPALKEAHFGKMVAVRQPAGTRAFEGLVAWDMDEALSAVRQPITVFGVRDLVTREALDHLSGRAEVVLVDLGSHHFPVESPEATAGLIAGVLNA
ncbi:pimeloyl-ACP methyl ester carboxylesterase [Amycolatopsis bartoniae]|uniref:Alpha/beta hydrolase n=1 Tax=Amycolatopsis bartoniae TaxID=941986 RepID=A0A8H9J1H7_9PSEU|nr:alpha/beta hydrolase [Amycolatopsis bartoniae]MBB2939405.1 pimeloyl-ACP methyl ester carboxylesterase [Amycolatopsis bartoniae]TVT00961.1 alpha/beta hydrolase [Amycolatopsis bartoniae]GHF83232.1 alpha/beta hydrolase [Amycolatopsis bartoniae]